MSMISQLSMMILVVFMIILIKESNKKVMQAAQDGGLLLEEEKVHSFEKEVEVNFQPENVRSTVHRPEKKITLVQLDEHHYPSERIEVTSLPFSIGRSKENALVLEDLCVARKHAQILEKEGKFLLRDQGTANKIYSAGRLCDEIPLYHSQRFYIGNQEFLIEMKGEHAYDK